MPDELRTDASPRTHLLVARRFRFLRPPREAFFGVVHDRLRPRSPRGGVLSSLRLDFFHEYFLRALRRRRTSSGGYSGRAMPMGARVWSARATDGSGGRDGVDRQGVGALRQLQ